MHARLLARAMPVDAALLVALLLVSAGSAPAAAAAAEGEGEGEGDGDAQSRWLARSGLGDLGGTPTLSPTDWPAGASFAGVFSDHAVLQRAPAKAAVYGVVVGSPSPSVTVTVTAEGGAGGSGEAYSVDAAIDVVNATYSRWKAFLKPAEAGGSYTVAAACTTCTAPNGTATRTISDVVFGDVSA